MKIPRFWSRGTAEGKTLRGRDASFSCWRSSDISEGDARASAMTAARRVLGAFISGQELNFLGNVGNGRVHPEVGQVVELHDRMTGCNEPLALA